MFQRGGNRELRKKTYFYSYSALVFQSETEKVRWRQCTVLSHFSWCWFRAECWLNSKKVKTPKSFGVDTWRFFVLISAVLPFLVVCDQFGRFSLSRSALGRQLLLGLLWPFSAIWMYLPFSKFITLKDFVFCFENFSQYFLIAGQFIFCFDFSYVYELYQIFSH